MTDASATVTQVVVSRNVAPSSQTDRFEIDPALQLQYQRKLRGTAEAVIGHFHSHPNGLAVPSDADRASPGESGLLWLIPAVQDGHLQSIRGFIRHSGGGAFSEWPVTE
jgi:proteasome lid subunit RPN8/RPN11